MSLEHRMIEPFVDDQVRDGVISYGLIEGNIIYEVDDRRFLDVLRDHLTDEDIARDVS